MEKEIIYFNSRGYAMQAKTRWKINEKEQFNKNKNDKITSARINFVNRIGCKRIYDVGCESSDFIEKFGLKNCLGFHTNKEAEDWLKKNNIYKLPNDVDGNTDAWTMWNFFDKHPKPSKLINSILPNIFLFISVPVYQNLKYLNETQYYKQKDRNTYFKDWGIIVYMEELGFRLIECNLDEHKAGNRNFMSFAFKRDLRIT